jgi:hypothetical protein
VSCQGEQRLVLPNVRMMADADLAEALEDDLYVLREQLGDDA